MQYEHGGNIHRYLREKAESDGTEGGEWTNGSLEELLDFSANINPLGLSPMGRAAMLDSLQWLSHYPDPDYLRLKEAMAAYYQTDRNYVSVFNGAAEGLHELFAYLKPHKCLIPAPAFVEYEKALLRHGTQLEWFTLKAENNFLIDEDRFLMTLEMERPNLVVICTPNNPTGQRTSCDFLEQVAESLKRWQGNLLVDEAFMDFLPGGGKSMAKWLALHENLYVLKSLTKFFGVPGLRLGAVLSANARFHQSVDRFGVPWRINTMAEHYALGALGDQSYMEKTRDYVYNERQWLSEALKTTGKIHCFESEADYLLLRLDEDLADGFEAALRKKGLLIRSCENYRGLSKGYFRIAVKDHEANVKLVAAIGEVLS